MVMVENSVITNEDSKSFSKECGVLTILAPIDDATSGEKQIDEKLAKVVDSLMEVKLFKRRWLQLVLFFILGISCDVHAFQFVIIGNITRRFYNVSSLAVEWTITIFMIEYVILLIPVSYLTDRLGLRRTILITTTGVTLGSWINVFAASPDRFDLAIVAQVLFGMFQVFVFSVPGRLASHWFGPKEVALATSVGFYGAQVGNIICCLTVPMVVEDHEDVEDIGRDFSLIFWPQAIGSSILTFILFFFFLDEPRLPPSGARALQKMNHQSTILGFLPTCKRVLKNKSFLILWNSFGLIMGVGLSLGVLLNPFYTAHFKDDTRSVGYLSISLNVVGMVGSVICSTILDKTKAFRKLSVVVCCLSILATLLYGTSYMLELKWMVFATMLLCGAPVIGYGIIGTELCVEITYPEPESITTGILNMAAQIYAFLLVLLTGRLLENYGDVPAFGCICAFLVLGTILVIFNKSELRREKARQLTSRYIAVPVKELTELKSHELRAAP
ncbi:feline leukemia virus subgroup C receptor-related protein 2-like [Neodiprion lecontei]|uniref:Feline leukemia virus subgroup C receptor-related protein 2-like n=1 Tax=Neodiprion lecontei TaxID=441921 RepID=A0A6J0C2U5_NEOLC|nr:feline leukemia virus subgroup C receptor-related protein 2-like [Neodiprion lecontei]